MKPLALTCKSRAAIACNGWMTVWEGAIRSGKTVSSLIAWLIFILESPDSVFLMSGKTLGSLVRNTLTGDFGLIAIASPLATLTKDRAGSPIVRIGTKTIYLFGATDDSAYTRVKGLTAGGWYADEVATHPKTFIVEAMARTAISSLRRMFWTLNPVVPTHYIYTMFLDTWEGQPGYNRFHFTLDENPAMTQERRDELAAQYHGRFYDMYILGLRCSAEGLVYEGFTKSHVTSELPSREGNQVYICCDYGTLNPCVFLEIYLDNRGTVCVARERRWDARKSNRQKTDSEYVDDMVSFCGKPEDTEAILVVDPSAASFIAALKNEGFLVMNAKNDVLDGIRSLSSLFAQNRIVIHASCVGLIEELNMYAWDERAAKAGEERPTKTHDHGPDALRYFVNTCMTKTDIFFVGD